MTRRGVTGWWLAAPPVAAVVAVVAATGHGLYVSPDGVFYVGTARNMVAGRGLTPPAGLPPIGHFPPLFPLVLALIAKLGPDPLTAARFVNAAAAGAIVLLVGLVVRRATGSVAAGLVASTLVAASVDLLTLAGSALSEPLFILLALSGLVLLARSIDGPTSPLPSGRAGGVLAAAALTGAAFLTRYVGVALVVAGAAGLVRFGRGRKAHGAWDAAVFGGVSTLPVLGYLAWAGRAKGAAGDRALTWHSFGLDYLGQAARPLARWILPWPRPPVGLVLAAAAVAALAVLVRRDGERPPAAPPTPSSALPWLLGAFGVTYLVVVVSDRLGADASGRLDARFLAPLHVVAVLLVVPVLYRRRLTIAPAALAGVLVWAQVVGAIGWAGAGVTDTGTARRGYTAAAWRTSPVMARIQETDPSEPVYSNAFDAIELLTGRAATPLPATVEYLTGRSNPQYGQELAAMRDALAHGGLLAYFDAAPFRRSLLPSRAELERALPLQVVVSDAAGTLYRARTG